MLQYVRSKYLLSTGFFFVFVFVFCWFFLVILASTYGPGPYGPEPLGPYGPGPLIILKNILS